MKQALSIKERLLSNIKINENGCWEWCGSKNSEGYGNIGIGSRADNSRKSAKAHRVSYFVFTGIDPKGRDVCHTCDNPSCINPEHLFLGTESDNMRDMYTKGRHPLPPEHCGNVKLTREKILQARILSKTRSFRSLAREYGVTHKTLIQAVRGETWKYCVLTNDYPPKEGSAT